MSSNDTLHSPSKDDGVHPFAKPFLFLDKPSVRGAFFWLFLVGTLAMIGLQAIHHFHPHGGPGDVFGFYAIMGFFGFCFAVLMGWPLRAILGRKADYYTQEGDDE
ncbi:hypothetical protein [Woodsholea maritima]|uniref:hypothetical protein n=1 Tax=Woodsholea maritima TaxID=240237 RepID=UPI0003742386|nr:hypothetical protein [Woodsholea maritima]